MALPNPIYGDGMHWQLATNMYFRLASGYIGLSPSAPFEYARWPIMAALPGVAGVPDAANQLKALLAHEQVAAVIVGPVKYRITIGSKAIGRPLPGCTTRSRQRIVRHSAICFPRSKCSRRSRRRNASSDSVRAARAISASHRAQMQQRYARARFEVLLGAADKYWPAAASRRRSSAETAALTWRRDGLVAPAFPRSTLTSGCTRWDGLSANGIRAVWRSASKARMRLCSR